MFKKLFSLFLVSVFLFTACRTKEAPDPVESFEGIELTYYKMFDDSDVFEPLIAQYEADHPGLNINYRQFTDFEEYQRVILNEMAEGEGPDIFSMQNTWFESNYKKLTPMPEQFGTPADFSSTFVDVAYDDLVKVAADGKERVYGLPLTVDTLGLYYNKDHFADRLPSQGGPSSTWEGIKEDVIALNKEDNSIGRLEVSGIAMGRADNIARGVDILYLLMLQNGVNFYNSNISEATFAGQQGGFGSYPTEDAIDLFVSFADEDQRHYSWNSFIADDVSGQKELDAFVRGDVSMIISFAYEYENIINRINLLKAQGVRTIDPDAIGVTEVPQLFDPAVSSEKRVTYANYFAETVSRNTEYPGVAWDFLLFISNNENADYYFSKVKKPTARRDLIDDQKRDPVYGVFAEQVGFAESFPIVDFHAYKRLFEDLITSVNDTKQVRNLAEVQDKITAMLPPEGLRFEKKEDLGKEE